MYKELSYITLILGVASLMTELLSLFQPGNKADSRPNDKPAEAMMISTILIEIVCSVYILKRINTVRAAKVKIMALLILGMLIATLTLRAKDGIFLKEEGKSHSMHNAASFLLCAVGVTWVTFWFFAKPTPIEQLPSIPLTDSIRQREEDYQQRLGRGGAVTRSADEHYRYGSQEMLPSYYELPVPPPYSKVIVPNLSELQAEHTSSTSRDFATNTDESPDSNSNQTEPQTPQTTTTTRQPAL